MTALSSPDCIVYCFLRRLIRGRVCFPPHTAAGPLLSMDAEFDAVESAELDEVKEFQAEVHSFPSARITWLKDGLPLDDMAAKIDTSLRQLSETR